MNLPPVTFRDIKGPSILYAAANCLEDECPRLAGLLIPLKETLNNPADMDCINKFICRNRAE